MAKIEPGVYEPRDDIRVFDGAEDEVDEEGSRLPLLIVIALLVLAAFAGVVYLAYTEGVQKGRSDAPRVITAQPGPAKVAPTDAGGTVTPYKGLKIYEQPAPMDEDSANEDSAPPPPTDVAPQKAAIATATTGVLPPPVKPVATVAAITPLAAKPAPEPVAKPPVKTAATTTQPVATAAPKSLTPATTPAAKPATTAATKPAVTAVPKPAPVDTKPLPAATTPAATAPAASSGSYVLQIGAYKSQAEANAAFASLKAKNPAAMSGFSPNVKQVDLGEKGTWYRLRVGSFSDKEAAAALCSRLGGGCFPAKN
jgi:cell division septation protein DedD